MNFREIAEKRQSCRSYDPERSVESEKIRSILEVAALSPSACNSQPYHFTVCKSESAKNIADAVSGMGMNKFAKDVPLFIVISEMPYNKSAALGSKLKKNDYRSIDIGIAAAYITAEAEALGLSSCILGWLDAKKIKKMCDLEGDPRLVIAIGYAKDDKMREKKRKPLSELVSEKEIF